MGSTTLSTPTFGQACKQFLDAGIPARALLPIAPVDAAISDIGDLEEKVLGKAPGRFNTKSQTWGGLSLNTDKKRCVVVGGTSIDHARWVDWPTPNVGILGHFMPGIDSDAETEDARRLVEAVLIRTFGPDAEIAERLRGNGPRRLYAFRAASLNDPERVVRTRHISYRLADEDERHPLHKIDIIGSGNQYLIAGRHQSGDNYTWARDWPLTDLFRDDKLQTIENADITRFIEDFEFLLTKSGGAIHRSSGGHAQGSDKDWSDADPTMPAKVVLDGLQAIPNNEANFPHRDDLVFVLSAVRATLGREAEENRDHLEAWACEDPSWCDTEYFEKVWDSLDRGVRAGPEALDRMFRRRGVFVSARAEFPDDAHAVQAGVRESKAERLDEAQRLLSEVASKFVFGQVNTRTDDTSLRMRAGFDPAVEWRVLDWWQFKSTATDVSLLQDLHACGRYDADEAGMWNFARDMARRYPHTFYTGETRHPNIDRGEIVEFDNPSGAPTREINMRFLSPVIRFGRKAPKNPEQSRADIKVLLDFVDRVFGPMAKYELDTLAYMAQSGKRPGHMLFLVGEMGVGKSIYAHMLISMFDGIGKEMGGQIDGTKMTNENARRFSLARVEGCRIISVKELPEGSTATNMAAVTSSLKQLVDPGPDGDYFQVEAKGKDSRSVLNFARVITTSNYNNSLHIEPYDRRIFFVRCGIDMENKPDGDYYGDLTDITGNPERLATLWRYLLGRDVSDYDVAKAPPVSREKREAQVAGMTNPWHRHAAAALETLRAARRGFFDLAEFAGLMSALAENEFSNTNGGVDDRREYEFGVGSAPADTVKLIAREARRFAQLKDAGVRLSTIYTLRPDTPELRRIAEGGKQTILDTLDRDRTDNPLSKAHPFAVFSGPVRTGSRQR